MKTIWQPVVNYGETFYLCRVEAFGVHGEGTSRRKDKALSYALEALAVKVIEGPPAEIPS
jgi:hypothetical protein